MSETERALRRVVLVLDTATGAAGLIRAGGVLAARLRAELGGVFVHDPRLHHLADLPGTVEVLRGSGRVRDITPDALARELATQVQRIAGELAAHTAAPGVSGPVLAQVRSQAELAGQIEGADLLLVGKRAGGELVARGELGSMASRLARAAPCPVVLLEEQTPAMEGPVMALVEDLEGGIEIVALAERLTWAMRGALSVVIMGLSNGEASVLKSELNRRALARPLEAAFHVLAGPDLLPLADLVWRSGAGLLAVGARSALARRHGLGALVTTLRAAVVLVP